MFRPDQAVEKLFSLLDIIGTYSQCFAGVRSRVDMTFRNQIEIQFEFRIVQHVPVPYAVCAAVTSKHAKHATASVESLRP